MSTMAERLPTLDDKQLLILRDNARRLETTGVAKQQTAATELLPLIEAEIADRKAKAPPPVRKARVKKVAAATTALEPEMSGPRAAAKPAPARKSRAKAA